MQLTNALLFGLVSGAAMARSVPRGLPGLDDAQTKNAQAAMNEVKSQNLDNPKQACLVVIATALQESTLHVYANPAVPESMKYPHDMTGGDQDSVGMFQQRPEWYPDIAADMDAGKSTAQFLTAMKAVQGWETMDVSTVCQTVQKAQAGNLYGQRVGAAQQICAAGGF